MDPADAAAVDSAIKKYYFDHYDLVEPPPRIAEREFGYQKAGGFGMVRHLQFEDEKALRVHLVSEAPSDVYCSNALYLFPGAQSMKEKSWRGADLIFDVDAKDLGLPCRPSHTVHVCAECSAVSDAGPACASCGSAKLSARSLPCKKCIRGAASEVAKLRKILSGDLGVPPDLASVYFSGNEGFHVHVSDARFAELGSRERGELADYIMFRGAIPDAYGMRKAAPSRAELPSRSEPGWRGRLGAELSRQGAEAKKRIVASGYDAYRGTLQAMSAVIGARIDAQVTGDVHRIFRLPGSINGKSGLAKVRADEPSSLDPYRSACLIDDEPVDVAASCPLRFSLGGRSFGPYSGERLSVPRFAAVYMICKNLATAASQA